jgi:2TM domain
MQESREESTMTSKEEYKRAEHDFMLAESRRGFAIHATVYTLVNTLLILLNVMLVTFTSAGFFWFPFPLVGWGMGLAMHYALGVRLAEQAIERRQAEIEHRAEHLRVAA